MEKETKEVTKQGQGLGVIEAICEMRNGRSMVELDKRFHRLREAVLEQRDKGTLVIKIDMVPDAVDVDRGVTEVRLAMDVTVKAPEKAIPSAKFFVTREGGLTRRDPDQTEMFEGGE